MTTRFPQLPVLGHVPKKRPIDLTKSLTLGAIFDILDSAWMDDGFIEDYAYGELKQKFLEATRKKT